MKLFDFQRDLLADIAAANRQAAFMHFYPDPGKTVAQMPWQPPGLIEGSRLKTATFGKGRNSTAPTNFRLVGVDTYIAQPNGTAKAATDTRTAG